MFLVSVAVRLPSLNRPLSKHHEFNAAMVLVGCEGWVAAGGPQQTDFCPLINYANPGDVYYVQHPQVKDGKLYYLSFGPGQFIVPYYIGRLLHIPYTPLLLQLINLLAHLLSAWLLYRIVLLIAGNRGEAIAKWAVLFFLFSAETLWFFGNGYVHESMVMPFFLAGIYYALRLFTEPGFVNTKHIITLALVLFTGIFFDWLMVFFVAGVALMALCRMVQREKKQGLLFAVAALSGIAATVCIIGLYSSYYGWDRFWQLLLNKYGNRNGFAGDTSVSGTQIITAVAKHFATGYLPLLLLLAGGLVIYLRKRLRMGSGTKLFLLLQLPVLVYFLVFASFSAEHDYSVLKFSPLIAVLAAFAISAISTKGNIQLTAALLVTALGVALYYYINPPGARGFNGDAYAAERDAGTWIKENAQPGELVTHNMRNANWLAVYYYSKRNNVYMPDADSARRYFERTPAKGMVWFEFERKSTLRYKKE